MEKAPEGQAESSFAIILEELGKSLTPTPPSQDGAMGEPMLLLSTIEESSLIKDYDMVEELPKLTKEEWQLVSSILSMFLSENIPDIKSTSSGAEGDQQSIKHDKGTSISLATILSLLNRMKQQEVELPKDVESKWSQIMKYLGENIRQAEMENHFPEQEKPSNAIMKKATVPFRIADHFTHNIQYSQQNLSGSSSEVLDLSEKPIVHGLFIGNQPTSKGIVYNPGQIIHQDVQQVEKNGENKTTSEGDFEISDSDVSPSITSLFQKAESPSIKSEIVSIQREHFVHEMTKFLESKIKITSLSNGTEARISLYPEHLGQVDVKITLQQGQMVAQLVAENILGKDLIESQLAGLRQSLHQQGIQVAKIEVQTASEAGLLNQNHQQQDRSGTNQQHQKSKRFSAVSGVEPFSRDEVSNVYDQLLNHSTVNELLPDKSIDFTA